MTTDTSVKYFDSSMSGAPALSNTAGTLVSVLDACLVNGFGSMTLTSLVIAGNVATAIKTGHGFVMRGNTGPVIVISGATPAELNTEFRIQSIPDANTFTFATSGIADQTATGTISAKRAPAGFSKVFSGTNKGAYQSNDITGTQLFLRVDDTTTTYARMRGYEDIANQTAFDGDTATGPYPTDEQLSGGGYLFKVNGTGTRKWTLFCDGRIFYFFDDPYVTGEWYGGICFGDPQSHYAVDPFCCILVATTAATSPTYLFQLGVSSGGYIARNSSMTGLSVVLGKYSHGRSTQMGYNYTTFNYDFLSFWPVEVWDSSVAPRGMMPGLWNPISSTLPHGLVINGIAQLPGRTLITQRMSVSYCCAIDITGPWR